VLVSYFQIAETLFTMGKADDAQSHADKALAIVEGLAVRFPRYPQWTADREALARLLRRIALLRSALSRDR
jgi:hypothetical protein